MTLEAGGRPTIVAPAWCVARRRAPGGRAGGAG
jgi:hypothetical protein